MMELGENRNLEVLNKVFDQFPVVESVFLFGSVAEGNRRFNSDIDLGIDGPVEELEEIRPDLLGEMARHGFTRVDIVFLRSAPPALAFEAVKRNRVLYSREESAPETLFSLIVRKYFDIRPYLCVQAEAYKKRFTND